jgi:phosphoglycolate phosphatase
MPRPGLVVFDCDGTLVDSQRAIVACMNAAFAATGADLPDPEAVRRVIGLPLATCVAQIAPLLDQAAHGRIVEAYKEQFFVLRQRDDHDEPLFDGALGLLDRLDELGVTMGIATGKGRRGLMAVLESHGLATRFATLQTGDLGPGKPHPAMLERAMAETGVDAAATVMIGDTSFDMQMARSAGVRALGVTWGYHHEQELRHAGAHLLVNNFAALERALFDGPEAPCA